MAIITCNNLSIAFGSTQVLDGIELDIEKGERLCITGRNGTGKSTLMRLIARDIEADEGVIWRAPGLSIGTLGQALPADYEVTVYDFIARAFEQTGVLLSRYHQLLGNVSNGNFDRRQQETLDHIQRELDHSDGWSLNHKIQAMLDRFDLDGDATLGQLSGGWRRRAAIGQSLVVEPDLWLLDEPTNHLDIPTIDWLEQTLLSFEGTIVFITHDRRLMQRVASSIVDLDRGRLSRWDCDYETFVQRKAHQLEVETVHNREFDKRLQKEEVWIRQGIQARRTRNEGRVRSLEAMRKERGQRRVTRDLKLNVDRGESSGNIVMALEGVSKSFADNCVIQDFDLIVQRGDRIGLLGANGAGKSTLLKIMLGKEKPDAGSVKTGTRLDIAYFDQLRDQLDPEKTLLESISEGREYVTINGKDTHVITWLGNFLFTPEQARSPVRVLSGGEQNRLLLARLFSHPANLIVMDEPTNDLDVESLELMEELLLEYTGTVLLVTHDRAFLDNVVSSLLVFEGDGLVKEHVGGYTDWVASGGRFSDAGSAPVRRTDGSAVATSTHALRKEEKRSQQKRDRELAALPDELEAIEGQIATLHEQMAQPGFFTQSQESQRTVQTRLAAAETKRESLYARWEELERSG